MHKSFAISIVIFTLDLSEVFASHDNPVPAEIPEEAPAKGDNPMTGSKFFIPSRIRWVGLITNQ